MEKSTDNIIRTSADVEQQDSHFDDKNGDEQRETWTNKWEYLLSMISNAVGLGNVIRFPYMCFKNGGGAFLIPYFVMLMVIGIPTFFLESSIGQFTSQGPIKVWSAVPILQGVGVSMAVGMAMVTIYYNVIISYSLYYLFASFQYPLPWSTTEGCNLRGLPVTSRILENGTCPESASEQYWDLVALQRSSGLDETGPVVWPLALCLLLGWILIAVALCKGIKSSGKVVYFTAIFPYVVLLILLIRGLTLEGAWDGIEYYIGSQSNMSKLGEAEVWKDAATQIFMSLGEASGAIICLSSYNKFPNNVIRDTVVVTLTNSGTSVFAGFAIFSILGYMAHVSGKDVSAVANPGYGLAFIAYPDALATLPVSPLWSILFFLMLVTLGLGSQFGAIETLMTCVADAYPKFFKSKRLLITVVTCTVLFFLGLPCVTRAGIYWVTLIDTFVTSWVLLIIGFFEFIAFIYIYGVNRLIEDIEMMIGKKSFCFWLWWRICWFVITPCIILVILIWSLATFVAPTYGDVEFPAWGLALGWCMALFCILWIPLIAVYKLMRAEGNLWQRVKCLSSPSKDWHPYLDVHRGERYSEHSHLGMNTPSAPEPNAEDTRL